MRNLDIDIYSNKIMNLDYAYNINVQKIKIWPLFLQIGH